MMTEQLAELFAASRSSVIEWNGLTIYAAYEISPVPERVQIRFVETSPERIEGLRLKIRGGYLDVNGKEADDVLLWSDTAPASVQLAVTVVDSKKVSLKMWNIWRGGLDVVQAWLGNAGMLVERTSDGELLIRCSDGVGEVDFNDLVIQVKPGW